MFTDPLSWKSRFVLAAQRVGIRPSRSHQLDFPLHPFFSLPASNFHTIPSSSILAFSLSLPTLLRHSTLCCRRRRRCLPWPGQLRVPRQAEVCCQIVALAVSCKRQNLGEEHHEPKCAAVLEVCKAPPMCTTDTQTDSTAAGEVVPRSCSNWLGLWDVFG